MAAQKVALEPLASAVDVAAFLHNVIIVAPHYNATLCKKALGKNLVAQVTQCTCFCF